MVIGRIREVGQKRWKVETHAKLDSVLMLSSVNLPGGELVSNVFVILEDNKLLVFVRGKKSSIPIVTRFISNKIVVY